MRKPVKIIASVVLLSGLFFGSCKKDPPGGTVTMLMTDAPAPYNKVNVEVKQVEVHYEDEKNGTNGWITLPTRQGVYNLLDLQNDITTTLTDKKDIPPGKLNQIRMVLGENNSLEIEGAKYKLTVPSGYTSGIKINIDTQVQSANNLRITLDFDAEHSVIRKGNGEYDLNPVIQIKHVEYD